MPLISALYVYPIKACRGFSVAEWPVAERGFHADRRWMIVDEAGTAVTQREAPELARVSIKLEGASLRVQAPAAAPLTLPMGTESGPERPVRIWNDEVLALVHAEGSAWFSAYLGARHQLVYMPERAKRRVNPDRARAEDIVSFADAYPFLLTSEASLTDLNARLTRPITMDHFRPNIVVSGTEAFAEDNYTRVRLGAISFRGPKRCERCVVINVDPDRGVREPEPLRVLATYRRQDQKVWFGMNLIHDELGTLHVGDPVET